ncbi:hypothetical protein OTU49_010224 [Cherax quadricarinatus]|uniref:Uncharacterized protein n=1 Tax=Cherax quadricarinatus TaxID=27406 RepID=A0AAW0WF04_CHEQU
MMRKTAKSRSTESSAAAERLADYKGDFGSAGGCSAGEDQGGGGCCSSGGGGSNTDNPPVSSPSTANSGGGCGGTGTQLSSQKEGSQHTQPTTAIQHTSSAPAAKDLSIKGMKEKRLPQTRWGLGTAAM